MPSHAMYTMRYDVTLRRSRATHRFTWQPMSTLSIMFPSSIGVSSMTGRECKHHHREHATTRSKRKPSKAERLCSPITTAYPLSNVKSIRCSDRGNGMQRQRSSHPFRSPFMGTSGKDFERYINANIQLSIKSSRRPRVIPSSTFDNSFSAISP